MTMTTNESKIVAAGELAKIVGIGHIIDDGKWFVVKDRMELLKKGAPQ